MLSNLEVTFLPAVAPVALAVPTDHSCKHPPGAPRLPQRLLLTCRPQSGRGGLETGTMSVLHVVECAGLAAAAFQNTFQEAIKTSVISLILMSIVSLLKASRRVRLPLLLPPHPRVVPVSLPLLVLSLSPTSGLSLSSV